MSKRIYTFEVELDDDYNDRDLNDIGHAIAQKASTRRYHRVSGVDKVSYIESYSEAQWDMLIYERV